MMSVHLHALLLPVSIVGLTRSPVSVCHRGVVDPPEHIKQNFYSFTLKEKIFLIFKSVKVC